MRNNITVLSGKNVYQITDSLARIKQEFIARHGPQGVEVVAGEQLELANLSSLIGGATLFATNRLVIIKRLSENKLAAEKFLDLQKNIPDEIHVVLLEGVMDKRTAFYKTLKKVADFHEFTELDEMAAGRWVQEFVKQQKGSISSADARLLVRYAGVDQVRLGNEVEKLLAFNDSIDRSMIEDLVEKNPEDTIFQLLEYAISGKSSEALTVLENLERAHEDPFQVANMLIWQTHILAVAASAAGIDEGQIAKDAKVNPFVIKKTRGLSRSLSQQKINQIIDAVATLDIKLKSTSASPWRVLEVTILAL